MAKKKKDEGHDETEAVLSELEKEINAEYAKAEEEVQAKLDDYLERFQIKDQLKKQAVENGQITQAEYEQWRVGQIAVGERWEEMKDTIATDLTNTAEIAKSISYGHMPEVYAINHNYGTFQVEKASLVDTSYTLYDSQSVERLFKGGKFYHSPGKLVSNAIDTGKQKAWDKRQVQSVMTQALLQGESIGKIATRLSKTVGDSDRKACIRNARTMTTGVENAGRTDSYKRAEKMGIKLKQEWLATLDSRTRHEHRMLDGQRVAVGEKFKIDGYELEYPGDPSGEPSLIYNCRCTLVPVLDGFEADSKDLSLRHNEYLVDESYDEWKESKYIISHPITKQDSIAETMRNKYNNEYRTYSGQKPIYTKPKVEVETYDRKNNSIVVNCDAEGVTYLPVGKNKKQLSSDEIIEKLAGGDKTKGSCSSLTYAYIGNVKGFDVTDFRGGKSGDFFAKRYNTDRINEVLGIEVQKYSVKKEASDTAKLLKSLNLEIGKEYRLSCGKHAAIIRNTENGYEYLEMQSGRKNGWMSFETATTYTFLGQEMTSKTTMAETLYKRFGCRKSVDKYQGIVFEKTVTLTAVDDYPDNEAFKDILGYINTSPDKQKKGKDGSVK